MHLLALAPGEAFVRDNLVILAVLGCVALGVFSLRLALRRTVRLVLFGALALVVVFVLVERDELEDCAATCSCRPAGVEVDLGFCEPRLSPFGR